MTVFAQKKVRTRCILVLLAGDSAQLGESIAGKDEGQGPDSNVTKLAKAFQVTRGAISKVTKRLLEMGAIERYQKPGNNKEIYYRLSDIGRGIYWGHEKMHQTRIARDSAYFSQLSEEEKDRLIEILNKIYGQIAEELKTMGLDNYI
ncbi:MarR family transcriptional regulator [Paenibacillus sp. J2TS4]|uniref:MarR family transcriptional regulator n=1 Tax=Paenibacillus sp. J2TS4 TaxID=2807194 RepID=UPI001B2683EC|nr:MarR family transcriptional regulator [Paenibacillus sp. J2TS4]GIP33625.1 hypothetical protein J2TS4_28350 [Paenibacillus sp. J2TS4]